MNMWNHVPWLNVTAHEIIYIKIWLDFKEHEINMRVLCKMFPKFMHDVKFMHSTLREDISTSPRCKINIWLDIKTSCIVTSHVINMRLIPKFMHDVETTRIWLDFKETFLYLRIDWLLDLHSQTKSPNLGKASGFFIRFKPPHALRNQQYILEKSWIQVVLMYINVLFKKIVQATYLFVYHISTKVVG